MKGISNIDEALENAEVLSKLDPTDPISEDEEPDMTRDCSDVRLQLLP